MEKVNPITDTLNLIVEALQGIDKIAHGLQKIADVTRAATTVDETVRNRSADYLQMVAVNLHGYLDVIAMAVALRAREIEDTKGVDLSKLESASKGVH